MNSGSHDESRIPTAKTQDRTSTNSGAEGVSDEVAVSASPWVAAKEFEELLKQDEVGRTTLVAETRGKTSSTYEFETTAPGDFRASIDKFMDQVAGKHSLEVKQIEDRLGKGIDSYLIPQGYVKVSGIIIPHDESIAVRIVIMNRPVNPDDPNLDLDHGMVFSGTVSPESGRWELDHLMELFPDE